MKVSSYQHGASRLAAAGCVTPGTDALRPKGGFTGSRHLGCATTALTILLLAACGRDTAPSGPTPPADPPTANAYILPGAVDLGATAFGDEPVVIYKGERLRWRNADSVEHNVVTDTASLPEFMTTGLLAPGGERSFIMSTIGTTKIHCTIHPQMAGTLVVQER